MPILAEFTIVLKRLLKVTQSQTENKKIFLQII